MVWLIILYSNSCSNLSTMHGPFICGVQWLKKLSSGSEDNWKLCEERKLRKLDNYNNII